MDGECHSRGKHPFGQFSRAFQLKPDLRIPLHLVSECEISAQQHRTARILFAVLRSDRDRQGAAAFRVRSQPIPLRTKLAAHLAT